MHLLKKLSLLLLLAVTAHGQQAAPKDKPGESKKPAETIVGVWHRKAPFADEYMTFTADGRAVMRQGAGESMLLKYTLDTSTEPWQMDLSGEKNGIAFTIFTSFDFPRADQFRMGQAVPDKEKRPGANALKESKLVMTRVKLAPHEGLHQVVEAFLKKLAGTWEGKDGAGTVTLTIATGGDYTMKVAGFTDKGRFSINVTKVPIAIDLLSSEGAGVKYSIVGFTGDGQLRVGSATANPEERETKFDDLSAKTYKKAEAAPVKPK
jgi:hypothetical protein